MTELDFRNLCRDACLELDHDDVDEMIESGLIEVDGVEMALFFDENNAPDVISCYVDLGGVPDAERTAVYENLLQLNAMTGTKTRGVFAIDPVSRNALLLSHLPTDDTMNGKELARVLRLYVGQAHALRATALSGPVQLPAREQDAVANAGQLA